MMPSKKKKKVKLLRPGHPILDNQCYAQCIVDMRSEIVVGYRRNYDVELAAVREWLALVTGMEWK